MVTSNITFHTITYYSKNRFILINDWEDDFYFSAIFPTLFLYRDSGHSEKKQQSVSVKV